MEKVTLKQVSIKDKVSSSGKPYKAMGIKTVEHGDEWLSGFANKDNSGWKAGMEVAIEIEKKEVNGKTFLNFKTAPSNTSQGSSLEVMDGLKQIYNMLSVIRQEIASIKGGETEPVLRKVETLDDF